MNNGEAARRLRRHIALYSPSFRKIPESMEAAVKALDDADRVCEWRDDGCGVWDTGCDNQHRFESGGPADNLHEFCPYCGGRLEVVK